MLLHSHGQTETHLSFYTMERRKGKVGASEKEGEEDEREEEESRKKQRQPQHGRNSKEE